MARNVGQRIVDSIVKAIFKRKKCKAFRIDVKPEGECGWKKTMVMFNDRKKAETFANIETAAGMGEEYKVVNIGVVCGKIPFDDDGMFEGEGGV